MLNITRKGFIDYTLKPGVYPRFMGLFASGFQHIPYLIALVYGCVRLLPPAHPYLSAANIGRFGVRHVIAEAANHLQIKSGNIDQILVFGIILIGIILMFIQMALLGSVAFIQGAHAVGFAQLFENHTTPQDLSYIMLDLVFGVKGLFDSCVSLPNVACEDMHGNPYDLVGLSWPFPIHDGLHALLEVYSRGLLVVAVFITLYFVATILAETAQTGTPFGKRYSHLWAPLRIVFAFGLLVPLSSGLNTSQYIVLHAAKYGTGFANNGWNIFVDTLSQNYSTAIGNAAGVRSSGEQTGTRFTNPQEGRLVATPNVPEVGTLLQFLFTAKTCQKAYAHAYDLAEDDPKQVKPYLVKGGLANNSQELTKPASNNYSAIDDAIPYDDLIAFANGSTRVLLRFGVRDTKEYTEFTGYIKPECGEITIRLEDPRPSKFAAADRIADRNSIFSTGNYAEPGAEILQRYYWYVVKEIWWTEGIFDLHSQEGKNYALAFVQEKMNDIQRNRDQNPLPMEDGTNLPAYLQDFYEEELANSILNDYTFPTIPNADDSYSQGAIKAQDASGRYDIDQNMRDKGWPIFASFYNKIATMGGSVSSATLNVPMPTRYPAAMEFVREHRAQTNQATDPQNVFNAEGAGNIPWSPHKNADIYNATYAAYSYWSGAAATNPHLQPTGNAFIDTINAIFGTKGLFDMRANADTHPLAQLVGIGRSLVDSSINNLGYAAIGGVGGFVLGSIFDSAALKAAGSTAAGFMITVAMLGITIGFVLFYIVPFLPFIYFFFAFGGWVKGIFEAMVGAPLWALAHIRIDGDGLPGQAAVSGYYLIFEIFLRPILILFGLLASITIYSASVSILNNIFPVVTNNLAGFDTDRLSSDSQGFGDAFENLDFEYFRGPIDEFFFTIVYALVVYMMGMASFKLIDLIPNNILRYMGQNISTFNDSREDPAARLAQTAILGGQQLTGQLGGGLQSLAKLAAN